MIIKEIQVKDVITKSNLPVCDYSVNPYTGCEHACKYCYACFMKRFTNHPENWGEFIDVKAIIKRAKNDCNLIWLENLNLRGNFKPAVMEYIKEKYPSLLPLYADIYNKGNNTYWQTLDSELQLFAKEQGLEYKTNDDTFIRPFNAPLGLRLNRELIYIKKLKRLANIRKPFSFFYLIYAVMLAPLSKLISFYTLKAPRPKSKL